MYLKLYHQFGNRRFILDDKGEATSIFTYINGRAREAFDFTNANRVDG